MMNILKQDRITLVRELLVTQMNHWGIIPLYVMLVEILGTVIGLGKPNLLLWLFLGIIPLALYAARSCFQKFWIVALIHLAVIGIMLLLPAEHLVIRCIHVAIGIGYVIYSFYLWSTTNHKKDVKLPPLFSVALSVVMLLILNNQGITIWSKAFVTILIFVLGFYFVIYYIERYQNFLMVNNSSAGHIPAKEMFKSGMGLVIGYTCAGLLVLFLISNIAWLKGILQFFKNMLASILRFISSFLPRGSEVVVEQSTNAQMQMMENMMPEEDLGEGLWIWQVLDTVMETIFLLGLIALLVAGIVFIVRFIINKLKALQPDTEVTSIGEVIDVREQCEVVKERESFFKIPFLSTDPKEKIRHLYKKRMLGAKSSFPQIAGDATLLNRYTARESGRILERDEMGLLYEKARYSNALCDNEDVKQMRNACK